MLTSCFSTVPDAALRLRADQDGVFDAEDMAGQVQRNIRQMVARLRQKRRREEKQRRREEKQRRRQERRRRREEELRRRESRRLRTLVDGVAEDGRLTRLRHNLPLLRQVRLRETFKLAVKLKVSW